ncbi:MAG: hypothetical protein ACYCYP_11580 [Leptospirales bacterium]
MRNRFRPQLFFPLIFLSALSLTHVGMKVAIASESLSESKSNHALLSVNPLSPLFSKTHSSKPKKKDPTKPLLRTFTGRLEHVNLLDHPMTVLVIRKRGGISEFVFGGDLSPQTNVFKKGKTVGVKSLKPGERVTVSFRITQNGPLVEKIRILE